MNSKFGKHAETRLLYSKLMLLHAVSIIIIIIATHHTDSFFPTGAEPTLLEMLRFNGRKRVINIPQEIGTRYLEFGVFLLEDSNGARVRNLELKHLKNAREINIEIIQEWIAGKGKKPVTWGTFINVLRDIDFTHLADEIQDAKK